MNRKNRRMVERGEVDRVGHAHGGQKGIGGGCRLIPNLGLRPGDDSGPVDPDRLLAELARLQGHGRRASST